MSVRIVASIHNLRQIHSRMSRHGEGEAGLLRMNTFDSSDHQRGHVEHQREGTKPRLITVLGSEEAQDRIGEMALQNFGGPAFPVTKDPIEHRLVRAAAQAISSSD